MYKSALRLNDISVLSYAGNGRSATDTFGQTLYRQTFSRGLQLLAIVEIVTRGVDEKGRLIHRDTRTAAERKHRAEHQCRAAQLML